MPYLSFLFVLCLSYFKIPVAMTAVVTFFPKMSLLAFSFVVDAPVNFHRCQITPESWPQAPAVNHWSWHVSTTPMVNSDKQFQLSQIWCWTSGLYSFFHRKKLTSRLKIWRDFLLKMFSLWSLILVVNHVYIIFSHMFDNIQNGITGFIRRKLKNEVINLVILSLFFRCCGSRYIHEP